MFKGKKGPYLLILSLIIVLIFIFGFQYGKYVEKTDETIGYVLSLTPPITITSPKKDVISYEKYTSKECQISFIYPHTYKLSEEATTEAILNNSETKEYIKLNCDKNLPEASSEATSEAILDNKKATSYSLEKGYIEYRIRNNNNKLVSIIISTDLKELIAESFKFIK